jgi:hypothetical protein
VDWVIRSRGAAALLYEGAAAESRAYFERAQQRAGFQLVLQSRTIQDIESFRKARIAAALYWSTGDRAHRREVEQRARRARALAPLPQAYFRLLEASVARRDARNAECRALLRRACEDLSGGGAEDGVWCVRYREAQIDGSREQMARARLVPGARRAAPRALGVDVRAGTRSVGVSPEMRAGSP